MRLFDIPPAAGNPRNSEGAFKRTGDGDILFAWSAFSGSAAEDHTPADLKMIRSKDNGNTWSAPETIVRAADHGAMNVMSLSLISMANGDIGLIYLVRLSWLLMPIVLRRSADGGRTWSDPVLCSTRPGYFVMNNDRAVRLASGRIILPAAEHKNRYAEDGHLLFAPADTVFFISDDDGTTWQEAETELRLPHDLSRSGLQEPGAVEISPGHLLGWARTDLKCQYMFHSYDNGLTWTAPEPSLFSSPLSPLSMKKLSDGRLFAVWNPVPNASENFRDPVTLGRHPLVYALSPDGGSTWSRPHVLEDDPERGYCYTALFESGQGLYLAYCAGGKEDGLCLNRLRIRWMDIGCEKSRDMLS